jgi:hypothetical protein
MAWTWRYESEGGAPVAEAAAPAVETFTSQADAETWLGENWRELLHAGVFQVTLLDDEREVYGPMGLNAPE